MKKALFGAFVLAVAVIFVGCKPNNNGSAITGIAVNPTELTLSLGETSRLGVTFTPSGVTGDVTWTTSDTAVAIVSSNGTVEAVGYGTANITATCEDFTAVCAVKVKTYLETLAFTGAILYDEDTTYYWGVDEAGNKTIPVVDTIEASSGATYYAYKSLGTLYVMSDNFYFNNSGYLDGGNKGAVIKVYAPFYYATKYLNNASQGTVFTLGEWAVTDDAALAGKAHVGTPGAIDEAKFLAYMEAFVNGLNTATSDEEQSAAYDYLFAAGDSAMTGCVLDLLTYHTTSEGYSSDGYYGSYIPSGVITYGYFSLNTNYPASEYMCGFDFNQFQFKALDDDNYYWGCNWNFTETSIEWADKTIHYLDPITYSYGEIPAESKKYEPINVPVMKIDYPEVATRMDAQLNNKQVLIKK